MKTYTYDDVRNTDQLPTDLRKEIEHDPRGKAVVIIVHDEDEKPHAEPAYGLYYEHDGRLGIAWGADAEWSSVDDLESGIDMWLNDPIQWLARN